MRLAWTTDAFLALPFGRAQARLEALGIPVLSRIARGLALRTAQVCIGRTVVMHPGVHLGHGQVVVDGFVEIHSGVVILPRVMIGVRDGILRGPTIRSDVRIGSGAKLLGPITVHRGARIGANATPASPPWCRLRALVRFARKQVERCDNPTHLGGHAGRTRIVGTVLGSRRPTCDNGP